MSCPFCERRVEQIVAASRYSVAFRDAFPLNEGHLLVVPRRHVASLFSLAIEEYADLWELVYDTLANDDHDANVGVNDGPAAGQTVAHAHVHIIPRQAGDVPDPRGGVRWVLPDKADYWSTR